MTGKHAERAITPQCPNCNLALGQDYSYHCNHWCGWVTCNHCSAVVDTRSGRFTKGGTA